MSINTSPADVALSLQIGAEDLGPLFVDRLRAAWNSSSPLAPELERYAAGSRQGSEGAAQVFAHPKFRTVATIVTQPDFRVFHRTGGGAIPLSIFGAYRNRAMGTEALVAVSPSFNGSYLLQYFPNQGDYLDWWVDTIASKVEDSTPNYLAPPVSLESLAYILHAVDAYRRASLHSLLSYTPTDAPFITVRKFLETMTRSMESMDTRWLLPAFLFLTPGLNTIAFHPRPEHMEPLADNDFLIPTRNERTGEDIFLFGEAGRTMGVEFYRSWILSVGFDTALVTGEGEKVLHRAFLAPTALGNHLISLDTDSAGNGIVNHQPLTSSELRRKLWAMLKADLAAIPAAAAAPARRPSVATSAVSKPAGDDQGASTANRCPYCGNDVSPGARFCRACGKPMSQPAAPKALGFCSGCGAKLEPGVRFCGECGRPIG